MVDRPRSEPETAWGAIRALLQAGAGVAYLLEDHPTVGGLLIALGVGTAVYEAVAWARFRGRRPQTRAPRPPRRRGAVARRRAPTRSPSP